MTRRSFFTKCALFVAGCQLGLQLQSKPLRVMATEVVLAEPRKYITVWWNFGDNKKTPFIYKLGDDNHYWPEEN